MIRSFMFFNLLYALKTNVSLYIHFKLNLQDLLSVLTKKRNNRDMIEVLTKVIMVIIL